MATIMEFRLLQAEEIQVRAGQKTKTTPQKIALLLYKDARADMERLDEQFGSYGWKREHMDVHGVSYCGVSLRDPSTGEWVTKWDAGEKSNTSPEKGEASDSFKRACVNWGIGRELYTAPRIYVPVETNTYDLHVENIAYTDNRTICALTIKDSKGNTIYQYNRKNASKRTETAKEPVKPNTEPAAKQLMSYEDAKRARDTMDFEGYLSDIDCAENMEQLTKTMKLAQGSPYYEALRHAANNKAIKNGWGTK